MGGVEGWVLASGTVARMAHARGRTREALAAPGFRFPQNPNFRVGPVASR